MPGVLITGGTGLIGSRIAKLLKELNFSVKLLSRKKQYIDGIEVFEWSIPENYIDKEAFNGTDYIIHVAGTNISEGRWTEERKKDIKDSRIKSSDLIFKYVKKLNISLKAFISASAIGYYGTYTSNRIFYEDYPPGNDFLSNVCKEWEEKATNFSTIGIRTLIYRIGVVLDRNQAALPIIANTVKKGIGAVIGNGKQYMPWIHIDDLADMFLYAVNNEHIAGIYNAVAPEHITNSQLTHKIAVILNKKIRLPNIPAFVLKARFGEMSSILLEGSRISADKIIKTGFRFNFDNADSALKNLLI